MVQFSVKAAATVDTVAGPQITDPMKTRAVTGLVTDRKGRPIIGATVARVGSADTATSTDADGRFSLAGLPGSCALQVSYIGFTPPADRHHPRQG